MAVMTRYINEIMGLAVLLLMATALVGGEVDANAEARVQAKQGLSAVALIEQFHQSFDSQLGERALSIGIALATDLSPFRGEDE